MNGIEEINHWFEEGNLYRAEKAIQDYSNDLKPEEKETFENLLNDISIRHYKLLADKAVISKNESLLKVCIQKLKEKNLHHEGLQNSLNLIITERRKIRFKRSLMIIFGLITIVFYVLFFLN